MQGGLVVMTGVGGQQNVKGKSKCRRWDDGGDNSGGRRVVNTLKSPASGSVDNGKDRRSMNKESRRRERKREDKKARKQAVLMMPPIHRSVPPFFFSAAMWFLRFNETGPTGQS